GRFDLPPHFAGPGVHAVDRGRPRLQEVFAVGGVDQLADGVGDGARGADRLAGGDVPDADRPVGADGGQVPSVGPQRPAEGTGLVAGQAPESVAGPGVPKLDDRTHRRRHLFAVRAVGHPDAAGQAQDFPAGRRLPDLDVGRAGRGKPGAVRGEGEAQDALVSFPVGAFPAGRRFPQADGTPAGARGERPTVPAVADAADVVRVTPQGLYLDTTEGVQVTPLPAAQVRRTQIEQAFRAGRLVHRPQPLGRRHVLEVEEPLLLVP